MPGDSASATPRAALAALLGAHLCFGIAHLAALPPFEGFDEPGHYSAIQQVADAGSIPRQPAARLSQTTEAYAQRAPMPYASAAPFDDNGGWTYARFFAAGPDVVAAGARAVHGAPPVPRRFEPGTGENYIAQHPPALAIALAPVYLATRDLSLGAQLFWLRATSYTFAWLALVISVAGLARHTAGLTGRRVALLAAALWPLVVPSWYPSMARLGNDSLAALVAALLWYWLVTRSDRTIASALAIGALIGAGALTKAFFVPVAAGTLAWSAVRAVAARDVRAGFTRVAIAAVVATAMAAWWYVGPSAVAVAGQESRQLAAMGGMRIALIAHFSIRGWLEGLATFLGMAAWSSTWSLARPSSLVFVPLVLGLFGAAGAALLAVRGQRVTTIAWLPFWWLTPVLCGFAYHILVHVALTGSGRGVGGYYLHVLAAPLAAAVGLGAAAIWRWRGARIGAAVLLLYATGFLVFVTWAQTLLFTGLLTKAANKQYALTGPLPAWLGVPTAVERLSALAFPATALASAFAGIALVAVAGFTLRRDARPAGGAS